MILHKSLSRVGGEIFVSRLKLKFIVIIHPLHIQNESLMESSSHVLERCGRGRLGKEIIF